MIKRCEILFAWCQSRPIWLWLALILLLSFLLKLLCWRLDPVLSRDGCIYLRLAQIWYNSDSFQAVFEASGNVPYVQLLPLFIYLIKTLMRFGISVELAGVGLNLVLGTFIPLLVYEIAKEILQKKDIALCAALLTALNPALNKMSAEAQRDMVYLFFAGVTLWMLSAGIRKYRVVCWIFAGLACGLGVLTRFESLEFLPIVFFVLIVLFIKKCFSLKQCMMFGILFYSTFVLSVCLMSTIMETNGFLYENYYHYGIVKLSSWKL